MLKGINGVPYYDAEKYLDMSTFDGLQPEIYKGFAEARMLAKEGTWMTPGFDVNGMSYKMHWKPIYAALEEFKKLDDQNEFKIQGLKYFKDFKNFKERNKFTRYLKVLTGAYDPYRYYYLWEEGSWNDRSTPRKLTTEASYFPNVVKWVENTITSGIFESIGRVIFFYCDADGISFEHRDLDASNGILDDTEYTDDVSEFLHIRPNTERPFYLWDSTQNKKIYINTRVAWWNDQDWHGGDRIMKESYGLRIDGKFTEKFRKQLTS